LAGFLLPNFRQKKASDYAGLGISYESGRVRGIAEGERFLASLRAALDQ
jgi:hypothetical protein